jgi:hypothetical protein
LPNSLRSWFFLVVQAYQTRYAVQGYFDEENGFALFNGALF